MPWPTLRSAVRYNPRAIGVRPSGDVTPSSATTATPAPDFPYTLDRTTAAVICTVAGYACGWWAARSGHL